jgi:hypothetical protein
VPDAAPPSVFLTAVLIMKLALAAKVLVTSAKLYVETAFEISETFKVRPPATS